MENGNKCVAESLLVKEKEIEVNTLKCCSEDKKADVAAQLKHKITAKDNEVSYLRQVINDDKKHLSNLHTSFQRQEIDLESLKGSLDNKIIEIDGLHDSIQQKDDVIDCLQNSLKVKENDLQDLAGSFKAKQEECKMTVNLFKAKEEEYINLKNTYTGKGHELQTVKNASKSLEVELMSLKEMCNTKQADLYTAQSNLIEKDSAFNNLKRLYEEKLRDCESLMENFDYKEMEAKNLSSRLVSMEETVQSLNHNLKSLQHGFVEEKNVKTHLQTLMSEKELEVNSLKTSLFNKESELNAANQQMLTKQRESVSLQELLIAKDTQMSVVRETRQRSENTCDTLQDKLKEKENNLKDLQNSVQAKEGELCDQKNILNSKDEELQEFARCVKALNSVLMSSKSQCRDKETELSQVMDKFKCAEKDTKMLRELIKESEGKHAALEVSFEKKDIEISEIQSTVSRNQKEISSLQSLLKDKESDIASMRESLQSRDDKLKTFQELLNSEKLTSQNFKEASQCQESRAKSLEEKLIVEQKERKATVEEKKNIINTLEASLSVKEEEIVKTKQSMEQLQIVFEIFKSNSIGVVDELTSKLNLTQSEKENYKQYYESALDETNKIKSLYNESQKNIERIQIDYEKQEISLENSRQKLINQIASMDGEISQLTSTAKEWMDKFAVEQSEKQSLQNVVDNNKRELRDAAEKNELLTTQYEDLMEKEVSLIKEHKLETDELNNQLEKEKLVVLEMRESIEELNKNHSNFESEARKVQSDWRDHSLQFASQLSTTNDKLTTTQKKLNVKTRKFTKLSLEIENLKNYVKVRESENEDAKNKLANLEDSNSNLETEFLQLQVKSKNDHNLMKSKLAFIERDKIELLLDRDDIGTDLAEAKKENRILNKSSNESTKKIDLLMEENVKWRNAHVEAKYQKEKLVGRVHSLKKEMDSLRHERRTSAKEHELALIKVDNCVDEIKTLKTLLNDGGYKILECGNETKEYHKSVKAEQQIVSKFKHLEDKYNEVKENLMKSNELHPKTEEKYQYEIVQLKEVSENAMNDVDIMRKELEELEIDKANLEAKFADLKTVVTEPKTRKSKAGFSRNASTHLQQTIKDFQILREKFKQQDIENQVLGREYDLMKRKVNQIQLEQ